MKRICAIVATLTTVLFFAACRTTGSSVVYGAGEDILAQTRIGQLLLELRFSAIDLDGKTVTDEVFKKYDVTLVNIWGTFCKPCLFELPELQKAYQKYTARNCGALALTADVFIGDAKSVNTAKKIWKDSACTFPAVQSTEELQALYENICTFPTTFLVDRNGKLIEGSVREGSMTEKEFEALFEYGLSFVGEAVKR